MRKSEPLPSLSVDGAMLDHVGRDVSDDGDLVVERIEDLARRDTATHLVLHFVTATAPDVVAEKIAQLHTDRSTDGRRLAAGEAMHEHAVLSVEHRQRRGFVLVRRTTSRPSSRSVFTGTIETS